MRSVSWQFVGAVCGLALLGAMGCSDRPPLQQAPDVGARTSALDTAILPRAGWTATASSSSGSFLPKNALDGNGTTRWTSGVPQANGQWFQVDMKAPQTFVQISLDATGSQGDHPRAYQVFVSNDGTTWGPAVATGTATTALVTIPLPRQTARHLRIVQTGSATNWWSIYELNVYQEATALPRNGWIASASLICQPDVPARTLDGNISTRWSTGVPQANGQSFQLDMLAPQAFNEIVVDSGQSTSDYMRGYQVFASNSTSNWGSAIATGTGAGPIIAIMFAPQTARYLRIVETASSTSWWSIAELKVYRTFEPIPSVPTIRPPVFSNLPKVTISPGDLPAGAHARFPARTGDDFVVTMPSVPAAAVTVDDVKTRLIAPILRAVGFTPGVTALATPQSGAAMPVANFAGLARDLDDEYAKYPAYLRPETQEMLDTFSGRIPPSAEIDEALETGEGMTFGQYKAGIERQPINYYFPQIGATFNGAPVAIEHTQIIAQRWDQFDVSIVWGSLLNPYHIDNTVLLTGERCEIIEPIVGLAAAEESDPCQAVEAARAALGTVTGVESVAVNPYDGPHLMLLPYGNDAGGAILRYAYRMKFLTRFAGTDAVRMLLWLDAETGQLLKLVPLYDYAVPASGSVWNPNPTGNPIVFTGTANSGLRVDPAVSNAYVLSLAGLCGRIAFKNRATVTPDWVSISANANGSSATLANFNQAPLNNSAASICASGTNKGFQQVNVMHTLTRYSDVAFALGVFQPFPEFPFGPIVESDTAQDSRLLGPKCNADSNMNIGACVGYFDPMCPNKLDTVMNWAHENTALAHEFGHNMTKNLLFGRPPDFCKPPAGMTCPVPMELNFLHDLADAWANQLESTNCIGGWTGKNFGGVDNMRNCSPGRQINGLVPRTQRVAAVFDPANPGDHFPEFRPGPTHECFLNYCDGNMVAAALWQVRSGMRSKCRPSGIPQYSVRLARAFKNASNIPPQADTDVGIYRHAIDFETKLVNEWATSGTPGGPPAFAHNGPHTTNKVTAGFAKAGFFLIPSQCLDGSATDPACPTGVLGADAVVDIVDGDTANDVTTGGVTLPVNDFLKRGSTIIPTFHVWTGSRYKFDATGKATLTNPSPCNSHFRVQISNDPTFPMGPSTIVSSLIQVSQNPTVAGTTQCFGTFQPTAAQWATLQAGGDRIYYTAQTQNATGGNLRLATKPGNGMWMVPPPYAVITANGNSDY